MKVNYYAEKDSLYIELLELPCTESLEVSAGVVLDYDAQGDLVGIDIGNASKKVQMDRLLLSKMPATIETVAG